MRILLIGAGGVGNSLAKLLATRNFYDSVDAPMSVNW